MDECWGEEGCGCEYGSSECADRLAYGNCPLMTLNDEGEFEWL